MLWSHLCSGQFSKLQITNPNPSVKLSGRNTVQLYTVHPHPRFHNCTTSCGSADQHLRSFELPRLGSGLTGWTLRAVAGLVLSAVDTGPRWVSRDASRVPDTVHLLAPQGPSLSFRHRAHRTLMSGKVSRIACVRKPLRPPPPTSPALAATR